MRKRISIIGLGLIGGSIGLALKQNSSAELEIVGYARHPETRSIAQRRGAIDKGADSLESAGTDAEIVIIATPVRAIREIMRNIANYLPSGCVVTDTASTKKHVMQWAREYLPETVSFIGGHPMAGKEQSGINAADAKLFNKCTYCLVEDSTSTLEAKKTIANLVTQVGAKTVFLNASEHDKMVAGISHLPNILSVALVAATSKDSCWNDMSKLAARGYKDTTRLASSDAKMLSDIFLTNQQNISSWIDYFIIELNKMREMINNNCDKELITALSQAKEARQRWLKAQQRQLP